MAFPDHSKSAGIHPGGYIQTEDPAVTFPNRMVAKILWFDTNTTPIPIKRRNDANTGWDVVGYLPATALAASVDSEFVQDLVGAFVIDSSDLDYTYDDTGNVLSAVIKPHLKVSCIQFEFGDAKNATSIEVDQYSRHPYIPAGTIIGYVIEGDISGSAVVDIQKSTTDPPSYSSICGTNKPTLSSDIYVLDNTLTGWSGHTLTLGNGLRARLESITTCKQVTVTLVLQR